MADGMSITVDASKLNAAIQQRIRVQGSMVRTFAQIVNQALFSVALNAQKYTPKADPASIDVSMRVDVTYTKTNKVSKKHLIKYNLSNHPNLHKEQNKSVPLAYLIVLARANISKEGRESGRSWYNQNTNSRWELSPDKLKGGRAKIYAMMERMLMARHSSGALLKAGWKPAMDILRPLIARNAISGGTAGERFAYDGKDPTRLGTATPAKEGWVCSGMIENHVGGGGSLLDTRQRKALLEFGVGPAERALAEEAESMMAYTRKYLDDDAEEFNRSLK